MSIDYDRCEVCKTSFPQHFVKDCDICEEDVCIRCVINLPDSIEWQRYSNFEDEQFEPLLDEGGYLRNKHCPFCSANEVSDYSVLTWYETKTGITEDEVKEAILKERNDNLDAMSNG